MDDMQSRIAARRAEIERQQRAASGGADNDYDDLFEGLFSGDASEPGESRSVAAAEPVSEAGVQDRIAARRAELDRERATAQAAAKAAEAARQAERKAASDHDRSRRERARLADVAPTTKEAADQLLRDTIRRRWPAAEWAVFGLTFALGVWLLSSHPMWGALAMLLAIGMYVGRNATHREELQKEYPELFGPRTD